jgi:phospholipase/carboxylesterase
VRSASFAGLTVRLFGGPADDGVGDGPLVVLLHGMTAPEDQLWPTARAVADARVRVAVPAGPVLLEGFAGGLAWWPVNIGKQIRLRAKGQPSELRGVSPGGLPAARELVLRLIAELRAALGDGPLVFGGFSQGAMLSTDTVLRTDLPVAGLVLIAGTILNEAEWMPLLPRRAGLRVLMTHARQDDVLLVSTAAELRDRWRAAGARVDWFEHDGTHAVEEPAISHIASWIRRLGA